MVIKIENILIITGIKNGRKDGHSYKRGNMRHQDTTVEYLDRGGGCARLQIIKLQSPI